MNTVRVIAPWRILSRARVIFVAPMRLAGTCNKYSNSAMPQLAIAATYHLRSPRFRRCAYQANVMNTFEAMSRRVVLRNTGMSGECKRGECGRARVEIDEPTGT